MASGFVHEQAGMISVPVSEPDDFDGWREQARRLVQAGVPPARVLWDEAGSSGDLFAAANPLIPRVAGNAVGVRASKSFLEQASLAICHSDPARFVVLYRLLWRLQQSSAVMDDKADPDVVLLAKFAKSVQRDIHKMRAFVRFRQVEEAVGTATDRAHKKGEDQAAKSSPLLGLVPGSRAEPRQGVPSEAVPASASALRYAAWFEPEHHILRRNAGFFVRRFANMRWSILTPRGSLHWDMVTLAEGPPATRDQAPQGDATEDLWKAYYASTFNPARLKIGAMMNEMPRKYWKNMPETALIAQLVAGAQARSAAMVSAGESLHEQRPVDRDALAVAVARCQRCPIGALPTRAVTGEGPLNAQLMIVGEQPGDEEEAHARPFIGPAGQVLDRHLQQAGIARDSAYVTNAVKHFKFEQRGTRRLHLSPTAKEIDSGRWWLESEVEQVQPRFILALGVSAARALLGKTVNLARTRGEAILLDEGRELWVTAHPSYLLRLDGAARVREEQLFHRDLVTLSRRLDTV